MATVVRFQTKPSQFFAIFDSLVAITTHPGAQNSRSGSFGADNDDAGQTIALPRFTHACGVIKLASAIYTGADTDILEGGGGS